MSDFSDSHIESYEKIIPVYQLYRMYMDERIVFPVIPSGGKARKLEKISETLEAILLGIRLPVVYGSERQDGSLLVWDSSDRLKFLIEFLEGSCPMVGLEFYAELNGYNLEQLEEKFPRITSLLYDYKISFQIIDYTTPRYMHMQAGNYIEKWNFTREQGIRNELYGPEIEKILDFFVWNLRKSAGFFSRWKLNRQYMILRILMYQFVFEKTVGVGQEGRIGLQLLLEQTAECLRAKDEAWKMETAADLKEATNVLVGWGKNNRFDLAKDRGKEKQAKVLGYLYNVMWMSKKMGYPMEQGLEKIAFDEQLWGDIQKEKVNFINIGKHYHEIEKRLRWNAEKY